MKNNEEKDSLYLQKRFAELANRCYQRNIYTYTDFLNLNEQDIFRNNIHNLPPVTWEMLGGSDYAERKVIVFQPSYVSERELDKHNFSTPFQVILVEPINKKFSEELSHRDVLGTLMGLGIDRCKIGDIFLDKNEQKIYIIAIKSLSDFICEHLTKIKHTLMKSSLIDEMDFSFQPDLKLIEGTVSSVRLDRVSSIAFQISRSNAVEYIENGMVFVNGKRITSNAYQLKENDIVSIRKLGRYVYAGQQTVTRKGRLLIKIKKYI